ncbi:hypothetical protein HRbin12_00549 [bacterium HR12]|nr:hypothetical protein HRbin12_00549 [bacterium HR12]GIU98433.1 MAG: hypothetical protein KatS3mg014_0049 [Actinomycetota bacterium]
MVTRITDLRSGDGGYAALGGHLLALPLPNEQDAEAAP